MGADTLRRLAERAYDAKEWSARGRIFRHAWPSRGAADSDLRRIGLSGLGWAKFYLNSYDESARRSNRSSNGSPPPHTRWPKRVTCGAALCKGGQAGRGGQGVSRRHFKSSLRSLRRSNGSREPADLGAVPPQYAFLAGVQAANLSRPVEALRRIRRCLPARRRALPESPRDRARSSLTGRTCCTSPSRIADQTPPRP